jgi:hypothetical protein
MDRFIRTLNNIKSSYGEHSELELRALLDPRKYKTYAKYSAIERSKLIDTRLQEYKSKITWSVVIDRGVCRQIITFPNAESKNKITELQKKESSIFFTLHTKIGKGLKLIHSTETPYNGSILNPKSMRIRIRKSYYINDLWRIDITLVKEVQINNLKYYRDMLIYQFDNWNRQAPFSECDYIDFEIEYTGNQDDLQTVTSESILLIYLNLLVEYDPHYYKMLSYIAQFINHRFKKQYLWYGVWNNSFHNLLPRAIEISRKTWQSDYTNDLITGKLNCRIKLDGRRVVLLTYENDIYVICDKYYEIIHHDWAGVSFILDCEELDGIYYTLHVLQYDGVNMCAMGEQKRLMAMTNLEDSFNDFDISNIKNCPMISITNPQEDLPNFITLYSDLKTDGLIFSSDGPYWKQRFVKWKPSSESSIDFLCMKCPQRLIGKSPHLKQERKNTLYLLFVHINKKIAYQQKIKLPHEYSRVFPKKVLNDHRLLIPFAPPNARDLYVWEHKRNDLNGKIVEIKFTPEGKHIFKCVRYDKISILNGGDDMGNSIKTALDTWDRIVGGFVIEQLWQVGNQYYNKEILMINSYLIRFASEKNRVLILGFDETVEGKGTISKPYQNILIHCKSNLPGMTLMDAVVSQPKTNFYDLIINLSDMEITRTIVKYLNNKHGILFAPSALSISDNARQSLKYIPQINAYAIVHKNNVSNHHIMRYMQHNTKQYSKFTQQISVNLPIYPGSREEFDAEFPNVDIDVTHGYGILLCLINSLCTILKSIPKSNTIIKVYLDIKNNFMKTKLIQLFEDVKFTECKDDLPDATVILSTTLNNFTLLEYRPVCYVILANTDCWKHWGNCEEYTIPSGKKILIPFSKWGSYEFLISGKLNLSRGVIMVDEISPTLLEKQLMGYHKYKLGTFKNINISKIPERWDECYNCRYEGNVINKYRLFSKKPMEEIISLLD